MHIYIENETELMQDFDFEALFTKVVKASADYVKIPYEISVWQYSQQEYRRGHPVDCQE